MPRTTTTTVTVQFGDCDPAGIVFYPNFQRWMDAASLSFFMQCGVQPWRELVKTRGIVETLTITTHVESWAAKAFVQHHRITRGETLICEGRETRVFVRRDSDNADRLRAIPVPEDIKTLCS